VILRAANEIADSRFLGQVGLDCHGFHSTAAQVFDRTDLGVIVTEAGEWGDFEDQILAELRGRGTPAIAVFNKTDALDGRPAVPAAAAILLAEAKVKTYLHSWGTMPIMEGNKAVGVVFESKSGRQAIVAKVVIDSTGDGDLLPFAGAGFDTDIDPAIRIANLSLCYWIDNVNFMKVEDFRKTDPRRWGELMRDLMEKGGHPGFMRSNLKGQEKIVWVHPRYANSSQTDVEELTRVEFLGREKMLLTHEFFKKNIPGFEDSFIVLSCPQLGTRGARRVHGDYMVTSKDLLSNEPFDDTIAIFPDLDRGEASLAHPLTYIPYRSLVPRGVENMLVACRAFSSDQEVNNFFNLIPHCVAFGEAAGAAAALSLDQGTSVRNVDFQALRKRLIAQNVPLPGAYPSKYVREKKGPLHVYEAPAFGRKIPSH